MFGIENFLAFVCAGILLILSPGPDTMFILGRSVSQGRQAGLYSAFGIALGCFVHITLATLGLSVILQQSQLAFQLIKYAGAAYLLYLGVKMLLNNSKQDLEVVVVAEAPDLKKIFVSGMITNILNPKVALFFIAFLPQFVQKEYHSPMLSLLVLGCIFNIMGTSWNMGLVFFSTKVTEQFHKSSAIKNWLEKGTGAVFILLGLKLALAKK